MSQQQLPQQPSYAPASPAVSGDARAMMMFEANKKSVVVAYLLWFFFGWAGGHRFYAGKIGSGVAQLCSSFLDSLCRLCSLALFF